MLLLLLPVVLMAMAACGGPAGPVRQAQTLKEFFGPATDEQIRAREAAFHYRMQQLMARCMGEAELPYEVLAYQPPKQLPAGGRSNPAFGKRYAYGISTLVGLPTGSSPRVDPNKPHLDGLDADGKAAWSRAWKRCDDRAYDAVYGPMVEAERRLQPKHAALEAGVLADPRMRAAMGAWSSCMRRRGHPFASPEAIHQHLEARVKALVGENGQPKTGSDPDELASLKGEERTIYQADRRCRATHVDAVDTAVRRDLEPPFVSQNYELLDRLRQPG